MSGTYQYDSPIGGEIVHSAWDSPNYWDSFKTGFEGGFLYFPRLISKGFGQSISEATNALGPTNTIFSGLLLAGGSVAILLVILKAYHIV
jgi:hypothetical protein